MCFPSRRCRSGVLYPSAQGSSVWLWGRKSTLPEGSKALGAPGCWLCGVQVPQPGWAGELSESWPCVWQWSVMTGDTAFSSRPLCQDHSLHPAPIPNSKERPCTKAATNGDTFSVTRGSIPISDPSVAQESEPIPAPSDVEPPPFHNPIPTAQTLPAPEPGRRISPVRDAVSDAVGHWGPRNHSWGSLQHLWKGQHGQDAAAAASSASNPQGLPS